MTGAEISATMVKPTLTRELKKKLIQCHKENSGSIAFLVWYPHGEETVEYKAFKWKGKAYEERQYMMEDDGYLYDQFLIVDIVDLNEL